MSCTILELRNICLFPSNGIQEYPVNDCDEVHPGIFLGNANSASDLNKLKELNIGHVLNAAHGIDASLKMLEVLPVDAYLNAGIQFLGIPAIDMMSYPLEKHFSESSAFIKIGLQSGKKVLVHCVQGISRSAALVLAFLVSVEKIEIRQATRLVRSNREILPNDGFLEQLCNLDGKRQ